LVSLVAINLMAKQRQRTTQVEQAAQKHLGYEELRPGQAAAIQSVLNQQDTLVVMPTGYGKSAIYQLAAVETAGATVVVSSLTAWQKDQANAIERQDLGGATQINPTI
jgi:ATP-dependent DNA helicase RecQ